MIVKKIEIENVIRSCHDRLWRHFIGVHGDKAFIYSYSDVKSGWKKLLPAKSEIKAGIPDDRIGVRTPLENCCLDAGFYVDAVLATVYPLAGEEEKSQIEKECRLLMRGLLTLGTAGQRQGFMARGVLLDGKTHYPVSSADQYTPAFAALWRYFHAPFATEEEKKSIVQLVIDVVSMLESDGFYLKFDDHNGFWRGELPRYTRDRASRLLEFYAVAADLVRKMPVLALYERRWSLIYKRLVMEDNRLRLQLFHKAYTHEEIQLISRSCMYQFHQDMVALRVLYEIEKNNEIRNAYRAGIRNGARATAGLVDLYKCFSPKPKETFNYDWRKVYNSLKRPDPHGQDFRKAFLEMYPDFSSEVTKFGGALEAALTVLMSGDMKLIRPVLPHAAAILKMADSFVSSFDEAPICGLQVAWWLRKLAHKEEI